MGFLSSIFGGGGGSSNSASTTTTKVTVSPATNIEFNLDELAEAIKAGNNDAVKVELLKLKQQQELNKINLNQKERELQQAEDFKKLLNILPFALAVGLYLYYKKGKK
jgi:hypothetical protein